VKISQRRIHRKIRVGERVVTGIVCPVCIVPAVIYPETIFDGHIERQHPKEWAEAHGNAQAAAPIGYRPNIHKGGRPPGSKNQKQMSSTGVQKKRAIRSAV
jgi:hypothetical protein